MGKRFELSELRREIKNSFSEKRAKHVFGCEETAAKLARIYNADEYSVRLAALLHDITKEKNNAEQLKLCEKYDIIISNAELCEKELLHAVTGAAVAADVYMVNEAVRDAIRYHTTGRADMTILEKIIYISDCIEPTRCFDGVEEIRDMAEHDLDEAMRLALDRSIMYLIRNKKIIHTDTLMARNWLYKHMLDA